MNTFESLALGAVQGLTEFLPVSSSGHLVLFKSILRVESFMREGPIIEVALHLGTLFSILIYYRKDVIGLFGYASDLRSRRMERSESKALLKWIVIGSIPTALVGVIFKKQLESCFDIPVLVGCALCITGISCLVTRYIPQGRRTVVNLGVFRSLCVGLAQGLAIVPGVSRSGMTIVTALGLGVAPREAARYSFLLSVPAVSGAALLKFIEAGSLDGMSWMVLAAGGVASALVGFLCLGILTRVLKAGNFFWF